MTLHNDLEKAIGRVGIDSEIFHTIVHGSATVEIETEAGSIKTLAKALHDLETDFSASNVVETAVQARDKAKEYRGEIVNSTLGVAVSDNDKKPAPLFDKLNFSNGLEASISNAGADEHITIAIPKDGINSDKIVNAAIVSSKIADKAITNRVINNGAISNRTLGAKSVTFDKLSTTIIASDSVAKDQAEATKLMTPQRTHDAINDRLKSQLVADIPEARHGVTCNHSGGVIMADGSMRSWGLEDYGSIGIGYRAAAISHPANLALPKMDANPVKWLRTYASNLIIFDDGSVWGFGRNDKGCLGLGNTTNTTIPTRVAGGLSGKKIIDAGFSAHRIHWANLHSYFLTDTGELYMCGHNGSGQLGQGNTTLLTSPAKVNHPKGLKWSHVSVCGGSTGTSMAIDEEGQLYSWGDDNSGLLGLGTSNVDKHTPQHVNSFGGKKVIKISVERSDNPWAEGTQHYGAALALTEDGTVWSWGWNAHGQLGLGDTTQRNIPTQVTRLGMDNIDILCADGELGSSYVLKASQSIMSCGYNHWGRIGQGGTGSSKDNVHFKEMTNSHRAGRQIVQMQQIGDGHHGGFAVLYDDGVIRACGYNHWGQLGIGTNVHQHTLTDVLGITKEKPVKIGVVGVYNYSALVAITQEGGYFQTGPATHYQRPERVQDAFITTMQKINF